MSEIFLENEKLKKTGSTQTIQIEQGELRQHVLGKVYRLLIELAEEKKEQTPTQKIADKEKEESVKETPVQLELL